MDADIISQILRNALGIHKEQDPAIGKGLRKNFDEQIISQIIAAIELQQDFFHIITKFQGNL